MGPVPLGGLCRLSQARARCQPSLQSSADRYHVESHPEHLCGAYPYAYPPVPVMPHHGFEDWSQIRYPPPPTAMEHAPPLPSSRLFHLVSQCPLLLSTPPAQATHTRSRGQGQVRGPETVCIFSPF